MSRPRWFVDIWDDTDPAVARGREALALRPVTTAPEAPDSGVVVSHTVSGDPAAPGAATRVSRRSRIQELVRRVESGDLSAVAALRELLLDR